MRDRNAEREWSRVTDHEHATELYDTDHVGTTGEEGWHRFKDHGGLIPQPSRIIPLKTSSPTLNWIPFPEKGAGEEDE